MRTWEWYRVTWSAAVLCSGSIVTAELRAQQRCSSYLVQHPWARVDSLARAQLRQEPGEVSDAYGFQLRLDSLTWSLAVNSLPTYGGPTAIGPNELAHVP